MAKPNGCLIIETRKFVIEVHQDIGEFGKEVRSKLKNIGWEEVTKCNFSSNDHVVCRKRKSEARPQDGPDTDSEDEKKDDISGFDVTTSPNTAEDSLNDNGEKSEEPESLQQEQEGKNVNSITTTETKDLNDFILNDRPKNEILRERNEVTNAVTDDYALPEKQDKTEVIEPAMEMKRIEEDEKLEKKLDRQKSNDVLKELKTNDGKGSNDDRVPEETNLITSQNDYLITGTTIKDEATIDVIEVGSELEKLIVDTETCKKHY